MIHLANDPTAAPSNWRASAASGQSARVDGQRSRSAHPWPFLSRQVQRPGAQAPVDARPSADREKSGS